VGLAENMTAAVPAIDTAEYVKAAETATREVNAPYLTVMLEGRYTDSYLAASSTDAPKFTDEELKSEHVMIEACVMKHNQHLRVARPGEPHLHRAIWSLQHQFVHARFHRARRSVTPSPENALP
jgi:hypothetical protein